MLIHGTSTVLDVTVALALASSALFAVDVNQAKISILLALFVTMVPFFILAPTASLLVEKIRFPRIAIAIGINFFRFLGVILMAMAATHSSTSRLAIFPLAFLMLVLSRCYVVVKTSALPQITNVDSFPYYSSRLSMEAGAISLVSGLFLFAVNKLSTESVTLFFAAFFVFIGVCTSLYSYYRLGKRVELHEIDANVDGIPDEKLGDVDRKYVDLSPRNRSRAIKSLFTYASSIRFVVGVITIGIGITFRNDKLILAMCFIIAAIASFLMNAVAAKISRTKYVSLANYFIAIFLVVASFTLLFASSTLVFISISGVLGAVSAYTRVSYESRAAHVVPQDLGPRLLARGEVWMQLCWVIGATLAVTSHRPVVLGIFCLIATSLSMWAYGSATTALHRTNERF